MQHKGEIVEKAVRQSGLPLTQLAKRMGKSRRWLYNAFDNPTLSIEFILSIGKIIHYDFSNDIDDLQRLRTFDEPKIDENAYTVSSESAEYWKNKYLTLLEKYNRLLGG
ncbi:MAG: hypothetical protein RL632_263 [Bacteroidota bacterium]|jgi:hypothetical protein